jgi:hypothetical protein
VGGRFRAHLVLLAEAQAGGLARAWRTAANADRTEDVAEINGRSVVLDPDGNADSDFGRR